MEYIVSKGAPGKRQVSFSCPACQDRLKTPLESAGQEVECPTCGHPLLIPGVAELSQQQAELAAADQQAPREQTPQPSQPGEALRRQQQERASAALQSLAGPPTAPAVRASSPMSYAAARPADVPVPQYRGLLTAKSVFWVLAMICYIAAAVGLVAGTILTVYAYSQTHNNALAVSNSLFVIGGVVGTAFYGFVLQVIGELIAAFRDIAMNSFRR